MEKVANLLQDKGHQVKKENDNYIASSITEYAIVYVTLFTS